MRSILFLLMLPLFALAEVNPDEAKRKAKSMVDNLIAEKFKDATSEFNALMNQAAPPEKLEKIWKSVLNQLGKIKKLGTMRTETRKERLFVVIPCRFEKQALDLKVGFDEKSKITAFFFAQAKVEVDSPPPPYAKNASFIEEEVKFGKEKWKLPGTLSLPKGDGPFPVVILVHGSGPQNRDQTLGPNKPFRDLAFGLATYDVAVLRYEKRTLEHSIDLIPMLDKLTLREETIEDAIEAARFLKKHKRIDSSKIFVLGHSLGAMATPQILADEKSIAGGIMMAANARPLPDLVLEQYEYLTMLDGKLSEAEEKLINEYKEKLKAVNDPKLSPETSKTKMPFNLSPTYWIWLKKYDQLKTASELKRPLLILQGERDYQVTMKDFKLWRKQLRTKKTVTLKSYADLNHVFMTGKGKSTPADYQKKGHVAVKVIEDITTWVKRQ